ncbi:MAG: aminotransferase class V-fold PLP-dependent enzyme [Flavobacteriaceae bacterium]|nr:aminotransferase class V-fold PLP-dependent enzyme [Flavobacteriaceae bacterium]
MKDLRSEFPALAHQTYLNNAATGLLSKSLAAWRKQHDLDFLEQGADYMQRKEMIEQTRRSVAQMWGAREMETSLIPNFSYAINLVWGGIPKGQKVLMLEEDYPSVRWPVETRDFDVCYAKIDENLETNIQEAIEKHHPDILIFSIVQWQSGIKIDLEFLKEMKAYHPSLLIIADGTQYLGTEAFDFRTSPIDVLAASGYKWLMAGFGNGLLLVKEEAQERIYPEVIGFNSAVGFDSQNINTTFNRRFEPGHLDSFNFGSLNHAMKQISDIGIDQITEQLQFLSAYAKELFLKKNVLSSSIANRQQHSTIFNIKGDQSLYNTLRENQIICSLRGGGIRVSCHYYNTYDDLERLGTFL